MRIRSLLAVAGAACLSAGLVLAGPVDAARASTTSSCATAVFETDGYGHGLDLVNFDSFNAQLPSGYQAHPIKYQDGVFPGVDEKPLDEATAGGIATLDRAVRDFHSQCPDSKMIIAGYSEGAIVAGDELNVLAGSTDIPHGLIQGVLYGDPRRPFGEGGIGGTAGGLETNLPTILPGVTMHGPRGFGDLAVHEICNENDAICNSANMITNALAFANGWDGYLNGDHGYSIDPVRDQGSGLTFNHQAQRIGFGAPLPIDIGTPWQLQQQSGGNGQAQQAVRNATATVNSALPAADKEALQDSPWFRLLGEA